VQREYGQRVPFERIINSSIGVKEISSLGLNHPVQTNKPTRTEKIQTRGISGANFSSIKEGRRGEEAGNISRCSVVFLYIGVFKKKFLYIA
jgi:hypothetical protein